MFSLIITIISIALVAALALASIYYGGTAFNRNSTEIKAAEIMLQQQQIRAAMSLYKVDNEGKAPQNLQELVQGNYLRQIPTYVAHSNSLSPTPLALAADAIEWIMPAQYIGTFVLAQNVSDNVCAEVNFKTRAVRGVPNQLYTSQLPVQCFFSADKNTNIVIVTDDSATVSNVLTGTNITPTDPSKPFSIPPSEINTSDSTLPVSDPSKWKISPASSSGSSGNSSNGSTPFDTYVTCNSSCSSSQTLSASNLVFSESLTLSLSNVTSSQAGVPYSFSLNTSVPVTLSCINELAGTCSISGNTVTFTATNPTSTASATVQATFAPSSSGPFSYTWQSNTSDNNLGNNVLGRTVNVSITPPFSPQFDAQGFPIVYYGHNPFVVSKLTQADYIPGLGGNWPVNILSSFEPWVPSWGGCSLNSSGYLSSNGFDGSRYIGTDCGILTPADGGPPPGLVTFHIVGHLTDEWGSRMPSSFANFTMRLVADPNPYEEPLTSNPNYAFYFSLYHH